MPPISEVITVTAVMASAGISAAIDFSTRRVPNALTLSVAAIGILASVSGVVELPPGMALVGFLTGFVLMLPGHVIGRTGGGDVKLMAALGTWLGPSMIVKAFLYSAIAGGLLALLVAARRGRMRETLRGTVQLVAARSSAKEEVEAVDRDNRFPYAPAIAAGSVLVVLGF
ncbi:MAG: A24 family peptidase [Vicinamibacterales bacterium]